MRLIIITMLLALASLACLNTGTQTAANEVLFSDDFSDSSKQWGQVTDNTKSIDYFNNTYRMVVNDTQLDTWSIPRGVSFTDVQIEVDAAKNGGPDNNVYGIICRYANENQFYVGAISSDGYYGILKMTGNGAEVIGKDAMLESDKISLGTATNHLRFDCVGSTLTLYANDAMIDQQTDTGYTTGNVGLLAGTFATGGTDILFDNFYVYKP